MAYKFHQGFYKPINPEKYIGDYNKIVYRSGLEKRFFTKIDKNPNVLKWCSEEFNIKYPLVHIDKYGNKEIKIHRYFPDVYLRVNGSDGKEKKIVVEIKPFEQCFPPKPKRNKKTYITECLTYEKNKAKWDACEKWCEDKGIKFIIITERNIDIFRS